MDSAREIGNGKPTIWINHIKQGILNHHSQDPQNMICCCFLEAIIWITVYFELAHKVSVILKAQDPGSEHHLPPRHRLHLPYRMRHSNSLSQIRRRATEMSGHSNVTVDCTCPTNTDKTETQRRTQSFPFGRGSESNDGSQTLLRSLLVVQNVGGKMQVAISFAPSGRTTHQRLVPPTSPMAEAQSRHCQRRPAGTRTPASVCRGCTSTSNPGSAHCLATSNTAKRNRRGLSKW